MCVRNGVRSGVLKVLPLFFISFLVCSFRFRLWCFVPVFRCLSLFLPDLAWLMMPLGCLCVVLYFVNTRAMIEVAST